jgi:hypothetical protein
MQYNRWIYINFSCCTDASGVYVAPDITRAVPEWVSGIDIGTCPACGGAVTIIACLEDPVVIGKILTRYGA